LRHAQEAFTDVIEFAQTPPRRAAPLPPRADGYAAPADGASDAFRRAAAPRLPIASRHALPSRDFVALRAGAPPQFDALEGR
jgi:hypothetical protein